MASALVKAAASAVAGGLVPYVCCSHAGAPAGVAVPSAALGSLSSLLYYARVWIQGYCFDKCCNIKADLTGKVAIVTGGTQGGLGFAAAEILACMGATIVLTVRSKTKGEEATIALKKAAGHDRISFVVVDFMSKKSIRDGAASIIAAQTRLDMLVLNAGVASGPSGDVWMANQVGPFLFTKLLTPLLRYTAESGSDGVRVVAVSSGAHKKAAINYQDPYVVTSASPFGGPYGQSKLAQIMHMRELQRLLREQPGLAGEQAIRCFSITPGFALTNLTAGKIPKVAMPLVWLMSRSPHMGAQAIKMACVDPTVPGGSYISNCYVKQTEGVDSCSNQPTEWKKLWALCEKCVEDEAYQ
eukprot:TRINITY_DN79374_c0_g1_i1.p1 TRINITY_DN79374_c0_g1~~TRINITY_DN79374_c0_g1_i1.p1  ORF type:complete len:356 (-),score=70.43 TRINITY_DN79374_c0_g1_i1:3-1070(-)